MGLAFLMIIMNCDSIFFIYFHCDLLLLLKKNKQRMIKILIMIMVWIDKKVVIFRLDTQYI